MTNKKNNIGFWRRFAAMWIDIFVIYSITKFIIALLSIIDFRISFGTLFIFIGAFYSTLMLSLKRQTIGKMLLQIIVTSKTNDSINIKNILLREVFGKWGMTILMPIILGQLVLGINWYPTIFDILIMIPIIILCVIFYLFTKKMWYEFLAGLTTSPSLLVNNTKLGFHSLLIIAILGISTSFLEYIIKDKLPCHMSAFQNLNSTKSYVNFLKKQKTSPVDYVIGLFDKYDIVVLCERAHPEMTQWDFIYDVIRNPKFINKVGNVFTEYGQVGMQDYINKFMATDSLDANEIHKRIIHIMHNMPVWPSWTNFNLYKYLDRLYHLNQTLLPENRIQHHFTDAAVDWSAIKTKNDYKNYQEKFIMVRDEIMAKTIIVEMNKLSKTSIKRPKCLVVMNYRHAMDLTDRLPDVKRVNTYEFLKDSFGNRAANVLINSSILTLVPIANGVWDAAFEKNGNKQLGFNFQGSPFGFSMFELYPINFFRNVSKLNSSLRYRDVFTGFVFINPIKDQYWQEYTPDYFEGFKDEYIRRSACVYGANNEEISAEIDAIKLVPPNTIEKYIESKRETIIELIFYCFSGIGLLIGILAFIFRKRKILIENIN